MKNVNVKMMEGSMEKVMGMKERVVIKKDGMDVMVVGISNVRERMYEKDWKEVERKDGWVKYRKMKLVWGEGRVVYCMINGNEREYGKKWLRIMVDKKFGVRNMSEEKVVMEEDGDASPFSVPDDFSAA